MKAMILNQIRDVSDNNPPLSYADLDKPVPKDNEILVEMNEGKIRGAKVVRIE